MNDTSDGLNKTLRQEKSLVYYSRINALFGTESGSVGFMTECDKKNVDEVIKTVIDYYNSIYENGFEPTFLKKSKRIEQFMNDRENAYVGKERSKLKDLCAFGKVPSEKKDEKIRKKLTIEECNSMFREAYNPSKLSVSVFGDIKKSEYMSEKEFRALVRK